MKHLSRKKAEVSFSTTKMVRVVISGAKKSSSHQERLLSFLWLLGAFLVIIVYILIPLLIALHQIPDILLEIIVAGSILLVAELIVSFILLKIARPAPTPSVLPKRYQPKLATQGPLQPVQEKMLPIDHGSPPLQLPSTPIPISIPSSQFSKMGVSQSSWISSLPTIGIKTVAPNTPIQLPQKLKLPSRS